MEMHPIPLHTYTALLPLMVEEPALLDARARLLRGDESIVAYADDLAEPTAVAVAWESDTEHVVSFAGEWNHATLAAYVRALERPATLRAPAALAAYLPTVRTDLVAERRITFGVPPGTHSTFLALPPGGVRRLRGTDARNLAAIPAAVWGSYSTAAGALREGIVYARYLRAEIVSLACVMARTEHYARITAFTIERARRNGFARECAQRLIGALVAEWEVTPLITSTAEDDGARGLAHTLGLTEAHTWTAYALA